MKEEGKGYILRIRKELSEDVWELRGRERELCLSQLEILQV